MGSASTTTSGTDAAFADTRVGNNIASAGTIAIATIVLARAAKCCRGGGGGGVRRQ